MTKEIKNIVFDMGRVLLTFSPDVLLAPYFSDPEDRAEMKRRIFESGDWFLLDIGEVSEEEMLEKWVSESPERLETGIRGMFAEWQNYLLPIEGMTELLLLLKAEGYRLYLLSNTSVRFREYCEKIEILRLLDGAYVSAFYHLVKPEPAAFRKACEVLAIDPEESFFVDDLPANVEGARSVGMRAFHFTDGNADTLVAAMRDAGIRI